MSAVRSECASTLGIDSDELELYGLCHIPPTVERGRLLKDSSGMMHLGVLVKRSGEWNHQTTYSKQFRFIFSSVSFQSLLFLEIFSE